MTRRIAHDQCFGAIIDVQDFFLDQVDKGLRAKLKTRIKQFARLLGHFRVPIVVTLERSVDRKGRLPKEIKKHLGESVTTFEKNFFDLTKEDEIAAHLAQLKKKQALLAGCETDVCVLQSCLGLLDLGYEVFLIEEILFSSSRNVDAAVARMQAEGAVLLSYKSLYYELIAAVDGGPHAEKLLQAFGPLPDDLLDTAA
jgi:nicotinamidase-related amidase